MQEVRTCVTLSAVLCLSTPPFEAGGEQLAGKMRREEYSRPKEISEIRRRFSSGVRLACIGHLSLLKSCTAVDVRLSMSDIAAIIGLYSKIIVSCRTIDFELQGRMV